MIERNHSKVFASMADMLFAARLGLLQPDTFQSKVSLFRSALFAFHMKNLSTIVPP
jgi:hypothetical protein